MSQNKTKDTPKEELTRLGKLSSWQGIVFLVLSILGICLSIYYIFGFQFMGRVLLNVEYYWLFIGLFSAAMFIAMPATKKSQGPPPWYDVVLAAVIFGICLYFFKNAQDMIIMGWSHIPLGIVTWVMMMEAARRSGGLSYFFVVLLLGIYPLVAHLFPGIFNGINYTFTQTIEAHVFRNEGMMGITTKIIAEIILGFLVFAGVLLATGAGDFFINMANAIFGKYRGGAAKVSVMASGFFGSLSGSVFSNVVGTGSITIATMKRSGYPGHYAGAIEACASTGGVLMPPVMGAIAFVMAVTIGVDYSVIMIAGIIPSFLFYLGLLLQVDMYAARSGLKGMAKEDIPSFKKVLGKGWPFLTVMIFLVWGLLVMRWEYLAPWYASLLMVGLSFTNKKTWLTPKRMLRTARQIGYLITQTSAIILPIAFVVSGLTITGVTGSVTSGLVGLGGGSIYLVLLLGIGACYVLGMAGLSIVAYIFLSVTLAPAIISMAGLNEIAVHLFIVYYAMLAGITPPVAAVAFLGATIADAPPMKTAMTAMRLGIVIYFVPLFFIFQPALVMQGNLLPLLYLLPSCILGIALICSGCEGHLYFAGKVPNIARLPLVIAGFLLSFPTVKVTIAGLVMSVIIAVLIGWHNQKNMPAEGNEMASA